MNYDKIEIGDVYQSKIFDESFTILSKNKNNEFDCLWIAPNYSYSGFINKRWVDYNGHIFELSIKCMKKKNFLKDLEQM
jgi:hypothetical protein